jgi:hypothetical protein
MTHRIILKRIYLKFDHKNCHKIKFHTYRKINKIMSPIRSICVLLITAVAFLASESVAFAPVSSQNSSHATSRATKPLMGLLDGEGERPSITRENEGEFFST